MKLAIIVYHKNLSQYPSHWIEKFRQSIVNQSYKEFDIYEIDYGGGNNRIFHNSVYNSLKLPNFVEAMNYLLNMCFARGADVAFNTNCDDWYSEDRIEKQLKYTKEGYGVISSNFSLIKDDVITHTHNFDRLSITEELNKNNNIICHPVVCYSREFWYNNQYHPSEVPYEDMNLWKRALKNGYKFKILPDVLCYHRLHENSVGHKGGEI